MKFLIGLAIFAAIVWYGITNWGWADWVNADSGFWYETKQMFSIEKAQERGRERQRRFDNY